MLFVGGRCCSLYVGCSCSCLCVCFFCVLFVVVVLLWGCVVVLLSVEGWWWFVVLCLVFGLLYVLWLDRCVLFVVCCFGVCRLLFGVVFVFVGRCSLLFVVR